MNEGGQPEAGWTHATMTDEEVDLMNMPAGNTYRRHTFVSGLTGDTMHNFSIIDEDGNDRTIHYCYTNEAWFTESTNTAGTYLETVRTYIE